MCRYYSQLSLISTQNRFYFSAVVDIHYWREPVLNISFYPPEFSVLIAPDEMSLII